MKYRITKVIEAKDLSDALKKEKREKVLMIEAIPEEEERKVGF
jgi:hypothetical protein